MDEQTPQDLTAIIDLGHNSVSLDEVALIETHLSDLIKLVLMQTDPDEE